MPPLAIKTLAAIIGGNGSASQFLLDIYPDAVTAFSTRKLRSAQTECLRVRRSSDNEEKDIGFSGEWVDSLALTTFCGSADGFVTTWYDQSGKGRDAVQRIAAGQPRIVTAWVINRENGVPALSLDGSSQNMLCSNSLSIAKGISFINAFTVVKQASLVSNAANIWTTFTSTGSARFSARLNSVIGTHQTLFRRNDGDASGFSSVSGNALSLACGCHSARYALGNSVTYRNNVAGNSYTIPAGAGATANTDSKRAVELFSANNSEYLRGSCAEIVVYAKDTDASRAEITTNQMTAFGVT